MVSIQLLQQIQQCYSQLRRSEQKVADFVLHNPTRVMHISIADLATEAEISEPTVLRFCRAVGCSGFQDFKLQLAQCLASGSSFGQFAISPDDSPADYKSKIIDSTISTLSSVRDSLDNLVLEQAINALSVAKRVEFYGFGASGAVAIDAQHKFFRLQLSAAAYSDPHMQSMSAATLTPEDCVIAISQTGRTRELIHTIQLVKKQQAKVIAICPKESPLASLCDFALHIEAIEDTDVYTPLTSRIAHLVVIDILAMGVAMSRGPELAAHLKTVKNNLRTLRISST
ncbi:transcriptional regulator HexR [Endozoicomonas sp. SM1973]|uniref:Transcriptional regulator HexR n=1 Tax=Spartinivicinus marinus TaxID=2994442 RepID=A0A853I0R2_9GAMM|nr:transcriptional regulator HexR [Spartinivicinus marinus]MCX4027007.1 transcriptional regulator HexR [Spartinivicinus marinus]NYZ67003.1 transcriptional regulator HexR [Spartinivicinus marinus]